MSATSSADSATTAAGAAGPLTSDRLEGKLGVFQMVCTVLAFSAPLAVAAGFAPLVIGYGNGNGAPASFVVIGVVLALFAVGLSAMARYMKSPGAFYSFVTAGLGRVAGLGAGFTAILGYICLGALGYPFAGVYIGGLVEQDLHGPHLSWWVWALVLWAIAASLSVFNIEFSARVLSFCLVAEVGIVLVWSLRVLFTGGPKETSADVFTPSQFNSGSVSIGLLFAALCASGFEAVAVFRDEAKDPVRTVPRATYAAVAVVCGLSAMSTWAFITSFGDKAVEMAATDPAGSFVTSVKTYLGTAGNDVVTILLLTSIFAAALAVQNVGARYLFAMGRDRVLPVYLGKVHRKHKSPYLAVATFAVTIVAVGIIAPAVIGAEPIHAQAVLSAVGAVCLLLLYVTTSISVIVYFRRSEHQASVWRSWIAPVLSFAALMFILYLAVTNMDVLLSGSEGDAIVAIGIIVAAAVLGCVLALVYRKRAPHIYQRIGSQDL